MCRAFPHQEAGRIEMEAFLANLAEDFDFEADIIPQRVHYHLKTENYHVIYEAPPAEQLLVTYWTGLDGTALDSEIAEFVGSTYSEVKDCKADGSVVGTLTYWDKSEAVTRQWCQWRCCDYQS